MTLDYAAFLESKRITVGFHGPTVDPGDVNPMLFPFQRDLVRWEIGRASCRERV